VLGSCDQQGAERDREREASHVSRTTALRAES
jgi:hypothetical protein